MLTWPLNVRTKRINNFMMWWKEEVYQLRLIHETWRRLNILPRMLVLEFDISLLKVRKCTVSDTRVSILCHNPIPKSDTVVYNLPASHRYRQPRGCGRRKCESSYFEWQYIIPYTYFVGLYKLKKYVIAYIIRDKEAMTSLIMLWLFLNLQWKVVLVL